VPLRKRDFRDLARLEVRTHKVDRKRTTPFSTLFSFGFITLLIKIYNNFNNHRVIIFVSLDSISLDVFTGTSRH